MTCNTLIHSHLTLFLLHAVVPVIMSLQINEFSTGYLTLNCTSTGSPATTVIWTLNGTELTIDGTIYHQTQSVIDRRRSTYENLLNVSITTDTTPGIYGCTVTNRLGISNMETIMVKGMVVDEIHNFYHAVKKYISCWLSDERLFQLRIGPLEPCIAWNVSIPDLLCWSSFVPPLP